MAITYTFKSLKCEVSSLVSHECLTWILGLISNIIFFFLNEIRKSILVIQSNPSVIWGNCPEWHEDYWNELDESWIILDTYVSSPESQISNRVSHLNIRHLNVKKQTKKPM